MHISDDLYKEGDISKEGIPILLRSLSKEKKTGVLNFINGSVRKEIYFNRGSVVFASSNLPADRLGDFLLRAGTLSEEQYLKSAEAHVENGKRKAMILVEMGYLTPEGLVSAIRNHITEIILSLFEWEEGHFQFHSAPPCEEVITLDTTVKDLISAGSLRMEKKRISGFIKEIHELYEKMESLNHYELLEVATNVSSDALKKAYLEKVKRYHPDRYNTLHDDTLKERLSHLLSSMNYAYSTLKDEKSREEYDNSLFKIKKSSKSPDTNVIIAQSHFRNGVDDFSRGNFWGASDFFRMAARTQPLEATYWAHLSLALSKIPKRLKEAEEAMLEAIRLNPLNSDYYTTLGIIFLNAGLKLRATREFENALKYDSDNKKAKFELEKLKK